MASLKLNSDRAIAADNIVTGIRESGKYVGVITRAESLKSDKGTLGLGLSFKADSGQTADRLDLYHTNGSGEELPSLKTVNAILCCTKTAEAVEGSIECEKWDKASGSRQKMKVTGYPGLMGKRIGLLLQQTLETDQNGKDVDRVQVFGVFNAETSLTASEMYAKKQTPERLEQMHAALMARPVRDNRKPGRRAAPAATTTSTASGPGMDMDDDIPF